MTELQILSIKLACDLRLPLAILLLWVSAGVYAADSCQTSTSEWESMAMRRIVLEKTDGTAIKIRSRVADDELKQAAGYQHICPQIVKLSSILFVYGDLVRPSFHMFNVHSELDIGFFDSNGKLEEILHMTPQDPGDSSAEFYRPKNSFQFALEIRAGFFESHELEPHSTKLRFR